MLFDNKDMVWFQTAQYVTTTVIICIKYKKLNSLQHRVRATKSHIQNSTNHFFWVISHAHTVVWECCKDDRQSQWEMAKFDPQPTLNPHQIWNTWLRRGHLLPRKIRGQSAQGFLPPTYVKFTPKTFECLLLFFRFFRAPTDEPVWPIFALNTSYDVVLRKEVPFGGEKN